MKKITFLALAVVLFCIVSFYARALPPANLSIQSIRVAGQPVLVFDHVRDRQGPYYMPDGQVTAWKNADGTVNLMLPCFEDYRMRGPDLEHLTLDPHKIFSSTQSANDIVENHYNYHHWFTAPYTFNGQTIYVLTHSEWYACLLNGDCKIGKNHINSWANTNNLFESTDGGATWSANGINQTHLVAEAGNHWTGSQELALKVYQQALNHSGIMLPSRLIKEGNYYYAVGFLVHRNFGSLNLQTGQAPIDKRGFVLIRTKDITRAAGWEAWVGDGTFEPISNGTFNIFLPERNGRPHNISEAQIVFDMKSKTYILVYCNTGGGGNSNPGPVYYMTTKSLARPSWSQEAVISGSDTFQPDPRGPGGLNTCNTGFVAGNYVSVLDTYSPGMNFEYTNGNLWLFYVVNADRCGGRNLDRDLYRVRLSIQY